MAITVAKLTIAVARIAANPNLYENSALICKVIKTKRIFRSVFIFLLIPNNVKKMREHRGVKIIIQHQSLPNYGNLDFFSVFEMFQNILAPAKMNYGGMLMSNLTLFLATLSVF